MTKRLNIDIIAKDKSQQALKQVQGNLNQTKASVINLKNALVGLGVGAVVKSFVDVGKEVESLQVRFKFLFGSLEEGQVAFDNLTTFAGRVPFSLEQISRASGNLAVVAKDAEDLNRVLEITGNVAAVTGLDFETTSSQIQRAFSGGIGAADLFRERGVRALLGFQAGAKVTAEETIARFEELFAGDGEFAKATTDLATTLEGTLSMIGDKYFGFQKRVSQEFFDELKGEFKALDTFFANNEKQIDELAQSIGKSLSVAITTLADGVRFVNENFETFKKLGMAVAVFGLSKAFLALAVGIGRASIAMLKFNRTAMKNLIGLLAAAGFIIADTTGKLDDFFKLFEKPKTIEDLSAEVDVLSAELESLADVRDPKFGLLQSEAKLLKEELNKLRQTFKPTSTEFENIGFLIEEVNNALSSLPFREINIGFEETEESVSALRQAMESFDKGFQDAMTKAIETNDEFEKLGSKAFNGFADSLTDAIMTGKASFKDFARSLLADLLRIIIRQRLALALQKAFEVGRGISGGGGIIGSIGKVLGFADGGRPPVNRPSLVGERGAELFLPDTAGTIIPNEQLPQMTGTTNINFTINTVDAQGVDELLTNRRSTIINVINDALNRQGKEALV
tara:strand:- start:649 stop:2520 length:1872 start_codon:yes stop_codon:yes gene_type:complete